MSYGARLRAGLTPEPRHSLIPLHDRRDRRPIFLVAAHDAALLQLLREVLEQHGERHAADGVDRLAVHRLRDAEAAVPEAVAPAPEPRPPVGHAVHEAQLQAALLRHVLHAHLPAGIGIQIDPRFHASIESTRHLIHQHLKIGRKIPSIVRFINKF
jgi:hypothetical protein